MDTSIPAIAAEVRSRMEGEGSGHDWWHVYRVWQMAKWLAVEEGAAMEIVELAALTHDIADWKFRDGDDTAGPRETRALLERYSVDAAVIDAVCEIVGRLSYKGAGVDTSMATIEGKCVQDADRLDAIGAIGIARAFAYGGHVGRPLHDPDRPTVLHASSEEYKAAKSPTITHFHEKLLLLKDRMQTGAGRHIAAARHAYMEQFLQEFSAEWDGKA